MFPAGDSGLRHAERIECPGLFSRWRFDGIACLLGNILIFQLVSAACSKRLRMPRVWWSECKQRGGSQTTRNPEGWQMKTKNIIRIGVVAVGLGAALVMTSSVKAQEIENTAWADGPNVAAFEQPAPVAATSFSNAAVTPVQAAELDAAANSARKPVQAGFVYSSPTFRWALWFASGFVAMFVVPVVLKSKRENRTANERTRA